MLYGEIIAVYRDNRTAHLNNTRKQNAGVSVSKFGAIHGYHPTTHTIQPQLPSNHRYHPTTVTIQPLLPSNQSYDPTTDTVQPQIPSNHRYHPTTVTIQPQLPSNHSYHPTTVTIQQLLPSNNSHHSSKLRQINFEFNQKKPSSVDERQISFPTLKYLIDNSNQFPKFNRASLLGVQENKKSCKLRKTLTQRHSVTCR